MRPRITFHWIRIWGMWQQSEARAKSSWTLPWKVKISRQTLYTLSSVPTLLKPCLGKETCHDDDKPARRRQYSKSCRRLLQQRSVCLSFGISLPHTWMQSGILTFGRRHFTPLQRWDYFYHCCCCCCCGIRGDSKTMSPISIVFSHFRSRRSSSSGMAVCSSRRRRHPHQLSEKKKKKRRSTGYCRVIPVVVYLVSPPPPTHPQSACPPGSLQCLVHTPLRLCEQF